MIWAIKNDERIKASPKQKAICELCNQEVISKCGSIKIWHWAHKKKFICDSFGEPETKWHYDWKKMFPEENQEIIIKECISDYCNNKKYSHNHLNKFNHGDCVDCIFKSHRADIRTKNGIIIELQNSPLSSEKIIEREKTYKKLIWIINGETIAKNITFFTQKYKWKWFPKSWTLAKEKIYIDKGDMFLYSIDLINKTFHKISKTAFIIEHGGNPFK